MHLWLEGEVVGRGLPAASWQSLDGIDVDAAGTSIKVEWSSAPDDSEASWALMRREVETRLLLETLEAVVPSSVRWTTSSRRGHSGRLMITSTRAFDVGSWTAARGPSRLTSHDSNAHLVDALPECGQALESYRDAMRLVDDEDAALGRLYLACERLVEAQGLRGERQEWKALGDKTGYGGQAALNLYDSLQVGRHVNPSRSLKRLTDQGLAPLSPNHCMSETGQLISKYLTWRSGS